MVKMLIEAVKKAPRFIFMMYISTVVLAVILALSARLGIRLPSPTDVGNRASKIFV